jgi:parallel beta-helix repeat protein
VVSNLHSTTDGIVIETSGVSVNLMGFSLTGDGSSGDYGIRVAGATNAPIEDLVITGGRISGFQHGLYCSYMNNSRIEQMVASGNTHWGFSLSKCNGNTISDCSISDNNSHGVYLEGYQGQCNGNTISDCSISDNLWGVRLNGYQGQCNGNTIANCSISDNTGYGVYLQSPNSGQCNGNTIVDCSISGNTNYGVYLEGQCDGNTIRGNTISKNAAVGVYLQSANRNRVEANHVAGTMQAMGAGIRTTGTTGNFILGNTCVNHETNFSIHPDDTFVPVETASLAAVTAAEPRTPIANLPTTISQPGSYYLVGNLASTTGGIVIEASGVTVDLMGFSLTGDGSSGDYGIHVVGATNAPIENLVITGGRISGFSLGLYCRYMNNSRIERMVVSGNSNTGVYLFGTGGQCNGNTISDCTISGNNTYGVYLSGREGLCNGNTISGCTISDNINYGVYLDGEISGQCNGNTIANCSISGNNSYGIYLRSVNGQCIGNTIRENTVSKNGTRGISLYKADGNRVEANHVWGTTGATSNGIRTDSDTTGNFILKNTCVGQVNNFSLDLNDTHGPVVSASGALAGADPWANFSR